MQRTLPSDQQALLQADIVWWRIAGGSNCAIPIRKMSPETGLSTGAWTFAKSPTRANALCRTSASWSCTLDTISKPGWDLLQHLLAPMVNLSLVTDRYMCQVSGLLEFKYTKVAPWDKPTSSSTQFCLDVPPNCHQKAQPLFQASGIKCVNRRVLNMQCR